MTTEYDKFVVRVLEQQELRREVRKQQVSKLIHTAQTVPTAELVEVLKEQGWDNLEIIEILEGSYEQTNS